VKLPVVLREIAVVEDSHFSQFTKTLPHLPTPPNDNSKIHAFPNDNESQLPQTCITEKTPRHVLVVDDAVTNRKLMSRLLKSKGFICHEAENGQECVDKVLAGEHPYEFILLDYEMPVMDGPSAARRLREEKCDLLIIGVTGNVLPEDKAYFINHGANLVLEKPLRVKDLLEELRNFGCPYQSNV
jgi:CheY-like chemotaxis protein